MAMMTLEGVGGLGEPLTSFTDAIPPPVNNQWESILRNQQLIYGNPHPGTQPVTQVPHPHQSLKEQFSNWVTQCQAAAYPPFLASDIDSDLKTIDANAARLQCKIDGYRSFPGIGYPPPDMAIVMDKLATDRAALIKKKAVEAAAAKIVADEAKDKSAKDKLEVITTGPDTGKILGMDSKTFMLVAAAGLVLVMMEKH